MCGPPAENWEYGEDLPVEVKVEYWRRGHCRPDDWKQQLERAGLTLTGKKRSRYTKFDHSTYDYEKENHKTCPVCGKTIDYHVDGFYMDEVLNVWICRDHKLEEILKCIDLRDKKTIKFIQDGEADYICPRCAGTELVEPSDNSIFELKNCCKCGALTARELGAVQAMLHGG